MTKITAMDLRPFYRNSIGVDRLFDRIIDQFDRASDAVNNGPGNYPPYNVLKTGEHTYQLELAVAGFTQGEIEVNVNDGNLIITGEKQNAELPEGYIYEHQGISARRFIRTFTLMDYVEVVSATNKDGILTIKLERHIPEAMKPKTIAISYES
jgi:molecular chaperone IbpA